MPGTDRPPRPAATPAAGSPSAPGGRARKLILRSQLGRGWIVASALFGLVILAAGVLFLTRDGHPGPPWVRVAALSSLPAGTVTEVAGPAGQVVVVDRRGGELRAFLAPPGSCPVRVAGSGFARPCDGQRWDAEGGPASELRDGEEAPPRCAGFRSRSRAATCTSTREEPMSPLDVSGAVPVASAEELDRWLCDHGGSERGGSWPSSRRPPAARP